MGDNFITFTANLARIYNSVILVLSNTTDVLDLPYLETTNQPTALCRSLSLRGIWLLLFLKNSIKNILRDKMCVVVFLKAHYVVKCCFHMVIFMPQITLHF